MRSDAKGSVLVYRLIEIWHEHPKEGTTPYPSSLGGRYERISHELGMLIYLKRELTDIEFVEYLSITLDNFGVMIAFQEWVPKFKEYMKDYYDLVMSRQASQRYASSATDGQGQYGVYI